MPATPSLSEEHTQFLDWLRYTAGFKEPRLLPNGKWVGIYPMMFTHAICIGTIGITSHYDDRLCYSTLEKAKAALAAWDGTGEPKGWHRHPASGRRVSEDGEEYINP